MSETRANIAGACPSCGRENEAGMAFCIFCGQALRSHTSTFALPDETKARICPACAKVDPFGSRFCIFCGQETTLVGQSDSRTDIQPVRAAPEGKKPAGRARPLHAAVALATGLLLGAVLALVAVMPWLEGAVVQAAWPQQGIVLFAYPPGCQVTVEEVSGRNFTLGQTGPAGSLSVADLPPGTYRVTLSAPGHKSELREVRVEPKRVTAVGFPAPIILDRAG